MAAQNSQKTTSLEVYETWLVISDIMFPYFSNKQIRLHEPQGTFQLRIYYSMKMTNYLEINTVFVLWNPNLDSNSASNAY